MSAFCSASVATLTSAQPLFADMERSCLREVQSRDDLASFKPPVLSDPACTAIGAQALGAQAADQVLIRYFTAINAIASFGVADAKALGPFADFLVSAGTSAYRARQLEKDLPKVSAKITEVVNSLIVIVRDDYVGRQLLSEEQKVSVRYRDFARTLSPEARLALDQRWLADDAAIEARRKSAHSLVTALQAVATGMTQLAANARTLRSPGTESLLRPFVVQLQTLLPQITR